MSRHFRYPKYTYLKDNTCYFSRSVPTDLRCFYTKPRIIQSLRTNSLLRAKTASKAEKIPPMQIVVDSRAMNSVSYLFYELIILLSWDMNS